MGLLPLRFCRIRNYNCLYICGTDEYGTATETKVLSAVALCPCAFSSVLQLCLGMSCINMLALHDLCAVQCRGNTHVLASPLHVLLFWDAGWAVFCSDSVLNLIFTVCVCLWA